VFNASGAKKNPRKVHLTLEFLLCEFMGEMKIWQDFYFDFPPLLDGRDLRLQHVGRGTYSHLCFQLIFY